MAKIIFASGKLCVIMLVMLLPISGISQDYLKIAEEYQQRYKEKDAAILSSSVTIDFTKDIATGLKVVERTNEKLLSLRYNASTFRSFYYDANSSVEKLTAQSSLKANSLNFLKVCGSYTQDQLFYDDSKHCTLQLKLKEVGEVWEINATRKIEDIKYLTAIYFSEIFPVKEKTISLNIPHEASVEIKEFNFDNFNITKTEKTEASRRVVSYKIQNLPGREKDVLDRGIQFNQPHLLILVKNVIVGGKQVSVLSSPQDMYNWYSSLTKQLQPKREIFSATVNELIKNKKTEEEKAAAIYYWVQDNIRYIAFEDGIAAFKPDEAHSVFEKRYGDCKGMANLLKEMLKSAGYDARLTWIGTKRIRYDQTIPSLAVNNHMICTLLLNGKKYYLDATEKYMPFGINSYRILDRPIMIEDGANFIADKITEADKNRDRDIRHLTVQMNGENLEGKYAIKLKGEAKKNFLYQYHYTKNDKKEDFLSDFMANGNGNVKTTKLVLPNLEERDGQLDIGCDISFSNAVSSFNNEFYIDLDPNKIFENWIIKDTRQSDIDFGERIYKKTSIELQLPKGFKVTHLPEPFDISEKQFSFSINYKLAGDKIIYSKEIQIPEGVIPKSTFLSWNNSVKLLSKAYENQIILQKTQ